MIKEEYYNEFVDMFDYDHETGKCYYNSAYKMNRYWGKEVGSIDGGYVRVIYKSRDGTRNRFLLHRLIYYKYTGDLPMLIDHIDRDKSNNKWDNLRSATYSENAINKEKPKSRSGSIGVFFIEKNGMWRASIKRDHKSKHLGLFTTKEEAIKRRKEAELNYIQRKEF